MNLQIDATLDGALIVVGPRPVHGARHDAHGFAAFGHAEIPSRGGTGPYARTWGDPLLEAGGGIPVVDAQRPDHKDVQRDDR
jgi:hypothetical protein